MTLKASVHSGLLTGLKADTLTKWGASGPTLLADFNFAAPTTVSLGSSYATQSWDFQTQTVAGKYDNGVGSATLDNTGGLPDQNAPYWNGTSFSNTAWEADTSTDQLVSSDSSICKPNGVDFSFRIVFRCTRAIVANDAFLGNYTTAGWLLYATSATNIRFLLKETTGVPMDNNIGSSNLFDGAIHYIEGFYDQSAEMMYLRSDEFSENSKATAAGEDDFSAGGTFAIGTGLGWASSATQEGLQILHIDYCEGANAQAMYDDAPTLPGSDPSGLLTTISRNSLISVPVSATSVAHFSGGTGTSAQMPIGYNGNFSDTNKLGLYCNSAVTNMLTYSEAFSNWGGTATPVDNQADSPDGFRNASSFTATTNNAYIEEDRTGADSTTYFFSVWVKRNQGTNVSGVMRLRDVANTTNADTAFTATDTWQLVTTTITTGTGVGTLRSRLYIDTNTESILLYGAQTNIGDARGAYIRTSGASAALAVPNYSAASLSLANAVSVGECSFVWVPEMYNALGYLWAIRGSGNVNRRNCYRDSDTRFRYRIYDGAGTSEDPGIIDPISDGTQYTMRHVWDESTGGDDTGGYEQVCVYNGTTDTGAVSPWEGTTGTGTAPSIVDIGGYNGGSATDAFVQSIQVYDGLNGVLP